MPTDTEIITEVICGNSEAYGLLVHKYQGAVYGLCYHLTGNFADAQDLAQEAFIQAYLSLGQLRRPDCFAGWLRQIAANLCKRWLEKRKNDVISINDVNHEDLITQRPVPRPDEELEKKELHEAVMKAVESLPEHYRLAVTLYYMDGLDYAEIANFLEVPISTVRGRLYKARQLLKGELVKMVSETFEAHKPEKEQFTEEVLEQILKRVESARGIGKNEEIISQSAEALEVLENLEDTPEHKRQKIDLLHWQGQIFDDWRQKPQDAVNNYELAFQLSTELADAEAQSKALKAIVLTRLKHGRFNEVKASAERADKVFVEHNDHVGRAFCRAAVELTRKITGKWKPGDKGGCLLSHFQMERSPSAILLEQPNPVAGNIYKELSDGLPPLNLISVLSHIYGPATLLALPIEVGKSWSEEFEVWHQRIGTLIGETTIESDSDKIVVPAGEFENCLRVVTVIKLKEPFDDKHWIGYALRHTGTRRLWFAPSVGLVKTQFTTGKHDVIEIQLVDYDIKSETNDYLPLNSGNRWEYEWMHREGAIDNEVCIVTFADDKMAQLACAAWLIEPGHEKLLEYHQRCFAYAQQMEDEKAQMRALFGMAEEYYELGRFDEAVKTCEQAMAMSQKLGDKRSEERGCRILAWFYQDLKNEREKWLNFRYRAIELEREIGENEWSSWHDLAGRHIYHKDYDKALECAQRALPLATELGEKSWQAEITAMIRLMRDILNAPDPTVIAEPKTDLISNARLETLPFIATAIGIEKSDTALDVKNLELWSEQYRPIAPPIFKAKLLELPIEVGKSWHVSWWEDGPDGEELVTAPRTIENIGETVSMPAGTFENCLKVKMEVSTAERDEPADSPRARWRGQYDGIRTEWYAPDVGLVKVQYNHQNGKRTDAQLIHYSLTPETRFLIPETRFLKENGFLQLLPLTLGNEWQYEWIDQDGRKLFHETCTVVSNDKNVFYLASSAYAFRLTE
ncbi:sigma-70 family RNA polymerase sigma factor [Candidatus Poribacteria bacterium]|nr:sigma-70 family RNA polymerase sigma factor [Candidatus Poribacteria bacterium]